MKSHELANKLLKMPNYEVAILDGFNGGGEDEYYSMLEKALSDWAK